MKCLNYAQVRKMYEDAFWAQQRAWENGLFALSIKYCKIANRLYNCLMNFPAENIEKTWVEIK